MSEKNREEKLRKEECQVECCEYDEASPTRNNPIVRNGETLGQIDWKTLRTRENRLDKVLRGKQHSSDVMLQAMMWRQLHDCLVSTTATHQFR